MSDKVRKITVLIAEKGTVNQQRKSLVASPEFITLTNPESLKEVLMKSAESAIDTFLKAMKL